MSHGKFLGGVWYCDCEVDEEGDRKPAIKLKVNDESKESFGRYFWRCPIYKNKEETCDFFLWEDEARHRESVGRKKNQSFSGTAPITPRHSFSQDQMSTPTSFRQTEQQQLRSGTFASSANRNASVADADSDGNDDTSMYFQPARSNFPTPSKFDFTPSKSRRNQLWRDTTPTPSVTHTINNALESFDMHSVTDEDVDHEAPTGSQATQIAPPRFGASVAITTPSKSSGLFSAQTQRHDLGPSQRQQANPNITPLKQAGRLYAAQSQSSPSEVRRNTLLTASEPNRKRPRNIDMGEEPETPSKTRMPAGQRTIKSFFGRSQADPEASLKANLLEMMKGMQQDMRSLARDNRDTRAELRETQEQLRDHKAAMRRLEERLAVYQNGGGTGMELVRVEREASDQEEQE